MKHHRNILNRSDSCLRNAWQDISGFPNGKSGKNRKFGLDHRLEFLTKKSLLQALEEYEVTNKALIPKDK